MRPVVVRWGLGIVAATIALLASWWIAPGRRELELDLFVLVLGGMSMLAVTSWLKQIAPADERSELEAALVSHPRQSPTVQELDRLERELSMGAARAFDLHSRVRPILREVASARLARRGLELDPRAPAVRALLGDELADLLDPDRQLPDDRQTAGPGLQGLGATIERLERL
jgi:hypothetical protein